MNGVVGFFIACGTDVRGVSNPDGFKERGGCLKLGE